MHDFKNIGVYFDKNKNLIGVPSTIVKKWNALVDIDDIIRLNAPYNSEELEVFLLKVMDKCFAQKLSELPKQPALQRFLGEKSYSASIKNLGLISLKWMKSEGYKVTPTWKNARQKNSYDHMDDKAIHVANDFSGGELAKALIEALLLSPIEPLGTRPK